MISTLRRTRDIFHNKAFLLFFQPFSPKDFSNYIWIESNLSRSNINQLIIINSLKEKDY